MNYAMICTARYKMWPFYNRHCVTYDDIHIMKNTGHKLSIKTIRFKQTNTKHFAKSQYSSWIFRYS